MIIASTPSADEGTKDRRPEAAARWKEEMEKLPPKLGALKMAVDDLHNEPLEDASEDEKRAIGTIWRITSRILKKRADPNFVESSEPVQKVELTKDHMNLIIAARS